MPDTVTYLNPKLLHVLTTVRGALPILERTVVAASISCYAKQTLLSHPQD